MLIATQRLVIVQMKCKYCGLFRTDFKHRFIARRIVHLAARDNCAKTDVFSVPLIKRLNQ